MRNVLAYLWALPNTAVGLVLLSAVLLSRGRAQLVDGVLETYGGIASVLLRRFVPIRGGVAAITFGHVVIGRDRRALDVTRTHERVHVRQCEIWGPVFIPAYLIASLIAVASGGRVYEDNYFERQARREAPAV